MAKFIKSFFTNERRKNSRHEDPEDDKNLSLSLDGRRKLSLSRSGRMKQSSKKRHSLSLDVYNQDIQMTEKPKNTEAEANHRPPATESNTTAAPRRSLTVEEEIDTAFDIINKTLVTDL